MQEAMQTPKPTLIVVTGRPASGKSTLAPALARTVRCPVISRNEIREGLVNTTAEGEIPDDSLARRAYEAFFDTITLLLERGVTLVTEAAFQHRLWAPKLEAMREIAHVRIIVCTVEAEFARSRYIARGLADPERERFHPDGPVQAAREGRELSIGSYDPPHLDVPMLTVDTSDGYAPDFATLVSFAQTIDESIG